MFHEAAIARVAQHLDYESAPRSAAPRTRPTCVRDCKIPMMVRIFAAASSATMRATIEHAPADLLLITAESLRWPVPRRGTPILPSEVGAAGAVWRRVIGLWGCRLAGDVHVYRARQRRTTFDPYAHAHGGALRDLKNARALYERHERAFVIEADMSRRG